MFDDGAHQDKLAGDGIFGAVLQPAAGVHGFEVQADGIFPDARAYQRTVNQFLDVAPKTVVLDLEREFSFEVTSASKRRARLNIPLKPENRALDLSDEEVVKALTGPDVLVSGELWAVNTDNNGRITRSEPIAWASGRRSVRAELADADLGGVALYTDLKFDHRWISNAARSKVFADQNPHFVVKNLKILDAKSSALRDEAERIQWPITFAKYLEIQEIASDSYYDPSAPENEDMTTGPSPEFVKLAKKKFLENGFPGVRGDLYAISGWCGRVNMWDRTLITKSDKKDAAGRRFHKRIVRPDLYFFRNDSVNRGGRQVHVSTFADELVKDLKDRPDVSEIWGFSQGGVAAIEARRYWTPLEAASRPGEPLVQTLAAEFYGTPLSMTVGPPPTVLGLLSPAIMRFFARLTMGCRLFSGETIGLGPVESRIRMSQLPLRISKEARSYAAHHKTGSFFTYGKFCNRAMSKLVLRGDDDAIVATPAARLDDSKNPNLGGENFEAYCHGKKGFCSNTAFREPRKISIGVCVASPSSTR